MKMWSGRFREPLDPFFDQWQRSIRFDWQLLPDEIAASRAHALALEAAGILTTSEASQIRAALSEILADYAAKPDEISGRFFGGVELDLCSQAAFGHQFTPRK